MAKIVSISEAASIALHSMILIARANASLNVIEIGQRIGSSKAHIAKVMQRLVKAGFLQSNRGPQGGFILRKKAEEITLLDIYEAIEGKIEIAMCPVDKTICSFDKCFMTNITAKMTIQFRDYMKSKILVEYL